MDLSVQSISKSYGDFRAIENTTFSIARSTVNVVMGPNSSGKTTIAKILAGVEKQDSGEIFSNFSKISYLPQNFSINSYLPINCLSVYDYITFGEVVSDSEVLSAIHDFCEFDKIKNKYPSELSGGMLRRFLISCSLAKKSDLIILDEPTQNLDIVSESKFYELILLMKQKVQATFVIVSHNLHSVMKYTDQVICIQNHLCCSGVPSDMLSSKLFSFYEHKHDHHH